MKRIVNRAAVLSLFLFGCAPTPTTTQATGADFQIQAYGKQIKSNDYCTQGKKTSRSDGYSVRGCCRAISRAEFCNIKNLTPENPEGQTYLTCFKKGGYIGAIPSLEQDAGWPSNLNITTGQGLYSYCQNDGFTMPPLY